MSRGLGNRRHASAIRRATLGVTVVLRCRCGRAGDNVPPMRTVLTSTPGGPCRHEARQSILGRRSNSSTTSW